MCVCMVWEATARSLSASDLRHSREILGVACHGIRTEHSPDGGERSMMPVYRIGTRSGKTTDDDVMTMNETLDSSIVDAVERASA